MKLTKEEAIRRHRLMWNWIADETEKQERIITKEDAFEHFNWSEISMNCWCCEYDDLHRDGCHSCPIYWKGGHTIVAPCCNKETAFSKWVDARVTDNIIDAVKYAREIANLPERENV